MRVPAVLAAIPLLAGAAAGVLLVEFTPERFGVAAAFAAALALLAGSGFLADRVDWGVVASVVIGCALAGFSMGSSRARELNAAPLADWAWDGRQALSDSDPVIIEGRLRDDAAISGYGASLIIDVSLVGGKAVDVRGGVRLTVGGAVPASAVERWRAGRVVRMPALLRQPTTFQNPGVPGRKEGAGSPRYCPSRVGEECGAGRGGATRLGARGTGVRDARLGARRDPPARRTRAPDLRRDRHFDSHRRSDRPFGRGRAAASGRRHLPRHCDIRREHRDSHRRARVRRSRVPRPLSRRCAGVHSHPAVLRAGRWRFAVRIARRRRRSGLSVRGDCRSSWRAAECGRRRRDPWCCRCPGERSRRRLPAVVRRDSGNHPRRTGR